MATAHWTAALAFFAGSASCIVAATIPRARDNPPLSDRHAVLVGAIRWDAWYDGHAGTVERAVEADLSPPAYRDRRPSFATEEPGGALRIAGGDQAQISREIRLAHAAGIDYWAFVYYPPGDPMRNALSLYLNSAERDLVKFCLIDVAGWGASATDDRVAIDARVRLLAHPAAQRVTGGRPIYYLMRPSQADLERGRDNQSARLRQAVDYLRQQVTAATGHNPYVVMMGPAAAHDARLLGADAISAYAIQGGDQGASYTTLAREVRAAWEADLTTGLPTVPTVMTGWDPRPRLEHPVPWGSSGDASYGRPAPDEIAAEIAAGLTWVSTHQQAAAQTLLIYAWNEYDEGGWLAPTYLPDNPAGDTARLNAVGRAIAQFRAGQP